MGLGWHTPPANSGGLLKEKGFCFLSTIYLLLLITGIREICIGRIPVKGKLMPSFSKKILSRKTDAPFITLALIIPNDGVWSNDKHFLKQDRIKIWTTRDLIKLIFVATTFM